MISKVFPTLYGVSSKGVTKVWEIKVLGVDENADAVVIQVTHGQLNGKMQVSPETIREGKNIGKANETSAYEQACLEAESKWKKQHDKNYTAQPIDAGMGKITLKLLPMLAQKFKERKKKIIWPAYVQPKLNGCRCLVEKKDGKIIFWSRKSKMYKNFNLYMESDFLSFMKDGDILDGELYNHGDITFQQLMSLIKNEKNPDIESLKKYVKFWCYDAPSVSGGFKDRLTYITSTLPRLDYVNVTETHITQNESDMLNWHKLFTGQGLPSTGQGYEGTMVRSGGDEPYNFQYRDNQLQKYKDFEDDEFKIIGAKEGVGSAEGQATLRCVTKDGKEFDVRCKGENAVREEQWKNWKSYVGKELTVRYQSLSDDGIPIFPVGITVRDYE